MAHTWKGIKFKTAKARARFVAAAKRKGGRRRRKRRR